MNSNKTFPIFNKLRQLKADATSKLRFRSRNYVLPRKYSKFTIPTLKSLKFPETVSQDTRRYTLSSGTPGAGAGSGGGAGGAVKEGGGGLGKYAAAQEEGYFYKKNKEQIKKLKKTLKSDEPADEGNKNQQG